MAIAHEGTFKTEVHSDKLTLLPLTALVVGSMIGGGVFNLLSDMSRAAPPGAFALKLALSGETYQGVPGRSRDIAIGALATLYGVWLVYAAGLSYLLMCSVLFAPGLLVYARARREQGEQVFAGFEMWLVAPLVVLAVIAAYLLWIGKLSPLSA